MSKEPDKNLQKPARRYLRWTFALVAGSGILVLALIGRPLWHLGSTIWSDHRVRPTVTDGSVDDASRLNETTVTRTLATPSDPQEAEHQLAALLREAEALNLKVAIAGARHTMGGHTIYPGGMAINMLPFKQMELDPSRNILKVGSGAIWSDIIPYLNEHGYSVAVMQSNNSFSVGGSISANCHGWQAGKPPIASTVKSFRLMRADGNVVRCSREENADLFPLVLGGYGLFGIILDVELRIVPNEVYQLKRERIAVGDIEARLGQLSIPTSHTLIYARLNITKDRFLEDAILNIWQPQPGTKHTSAPLSIVSSATARRALFRGSVRNDYGKRLRWWAESNLDPQFASNQVSRNDLLNVSVDLFENRSPEDTDILHEYFVPRDRLEAFCKRSAGVIKDHRANLLNVTVRTVEPDTDTFLRYATEPMYCLVMLFNHQHTVDADKTMEAVTQELINTALEEGGRYYLPYRLHATKSQLRKAYPQIDRFFELKKHYDPTEIFQNQFYLEYATQWN